MQAVLAIDSAAGLIEYRLIQAGSSGKTVIRLASPRDDSTFTTIPRGGDRDAGRTGAGATWADATWASTTVERR
jgi:hypothetical protein